jgi:hypothetical protein
MVVIDSGPVIVGLLRGSSLAEPDKQCTNQRLSSDDEETVIKGHDIGLPPHNLLGRGYGRDAAEVALTSKLRSVGTHFHEGDWWNEPRAYRSRVSLSISALRCEVHDRILVGHFLTFRSGAGSYFFAGSLFRVISYNQSGRLSRSLSNQ